MHFKAELQTDVRIDVHVCGAHKQLSVFNVQLPEPLTTNQISLYNLAEGAPALLVMFICNHCPFVVLLKEKIVEVCKEYMDQGVAVVAISSNSIKTHPQDGPHRMADDAKNLGEALPHSLIHSSTHTHGHNTVDVSMATSGHAYRHVCIANFPITHRLSIPLPLRRDTGRRQAVQGSLHTRVLCV